MHACIDLGSNSFHLLIGEWQGGAIKIVERLSDKIQLGENISETGCISPEAFERGIACLHRFAHLMAQYPVQQYWALGTNTFRVAKNADSFVARAAVQVAALLAHIVCEVVVVVAGAVAWRSNGEAVRMANSQIWTRLLRSFTH